MRILFKLRITEDVDRGVEVVSVVFRRKDGTKYDPSEERELVEMLRSRLCWVVPVDLILAAESGDLVRSSSPFSGTEELADVDKT
jgi:hypothetical protein